MLKTKSPYVIVSLLLLPVFFLIGCKPKNHYIQGYVDARYVYVASNVSGRLKSLYVRRGNNVQLNQLLFNLELEPQKSELAQAQTQVTLAAAQLKSTQAGLDLARITVNRRSALEKEKLIDRQAADEARSQYRQAIAAWNQATSNFQNAEAALTKAQWFYSEKRIASPKAAVVFDTYYLPGELVPANQAVLSLISPENIYVIFYVSGLDLAHLKIGAPINIYEPGIKNAITAKISYISPTAEYTPPVIYSNDTNNKLVFRIEATPTTPTLALHPGQPVDVIPTVSN